MLNINFVVTMKLTLFIRDRVIKKINELCTSDIGLMTI